MIIKSLADMTPAELQVEQEAAHQEYLTADHIDGLYAWKVARAAAQARIDAASAEWARRMMGETNG